MPEALELICMKAMASDLEKRYASADEMLADLEEFRKNPEVDLDFTIEDLHRETVDEPTQYIPAVHTVSKAQKVQEADDEEEEEASPHKLGTRQAAHDHRRGGGRGGTHRAALARDFQRSSRRRADADRSMWCRISSA